MDYNTFERAFDLVRSNTLEELNESKKAISLLISEFNEEKKILSNEIRFSTEYYTINALDIDRRINEIDKRIPNLNKGINNQLHHQMRGEAESRVILRVRALLRERKRLSKTKSDYENKVRRLNQELVDLYLDIESARRKLVDTANAIHVIKRASEKDIHFEIGSKAITKDVYVFLRKIEVI